MRRRSAGRKVSPWRRTACCTRERATERAGEREREGERDRERERERARARGRERERGREGEKERGRDMGSRPIENKYHEGTVKRTLKRKVKVLEVAENEVSEATMSW